MRSLVLVLLAVAVGSACSRSVEAPDVVRRIVDELAAQRYAFATARYRQNEDLVLSEAAAPGWRRALEHEDATVREWAVDALSRIGDPDDLEALEARLDDPFRKVQEAAASGLIRMDPEYARRAFETRLGADDPIAVAVVALALADVGSRESTPLLIERLQDAALDPGARGVVAEALSRLGDSRAAGPLAAVALDPSLELQLRRTAAEGLAVLEGPEVEAALRSLLSADDEYVKDVARRVLQ